MRARGARSVDKVQISCKFPANFRVMPALGIIACPHRCKGKGEGKGSGGGGRGGGGGGEGGCRRWGVAMKLDLHDKVVFNSEFWRNCDFQV
jgi:hypothetical protein